MQTTQLSKLATSYQVRTAITIMTFFLLMLVPIIVLAAEADAQPEPTAIHDGTLSYTHGYGLMTSNQHLFVTSANWADFSDAPANTLSYTHGYGLMTNNQQLFVASANWADFSDKPADTLSYTHGYGLMNSNQHLFVASANWADFNN